MTKNKIIILTTLVASCTILAGISIALWNYNNTQNSSQKKSPNLFSQVELADTPTKREIGLMNRKNLCSDCAMLFVFQEPNQYSFWMKNTLIPLDIIFIKDDGVIDNICYNMQPEDIRTQCIAKSPIKLVLETNPNYLKSKGYEINSKLDIESIKKQSDLKINPK
jgi:uncharacterized protein